MISPSCYCLDLVVCCGFKDMQYVYGDTDSHNPVAVHFFACSCTASCLCCVRTRVYVGLGVGGCVVMCCFMSLMSTNTRIRGSCGGVGGGNNVPSSCVVICCFMSLMCTTTRILGSWGGAEGNLITFLHRAWSCAASCL